LISLLICLSVVGVADSAADDASAVQLWSAQSTNGVYEVSIRTESGLSPPVGETHRWIFSIKDSDGRPVYPALISIGGGMRGHGHGLPTQPQAIAYGGNGDYLVAGMRFAMFGEWRLSFVIESEAGRDRVDFDIVVAAKPIRNSGSDSGLHAWSKSELAVLRSLQLAEGRELPVNPSNGAANSSVAAKLGERLFFDVRASGNGEVSCASCHQPDRHYTDGRARSKGAGELMRNSPSVVGGAYMQWFYWDGRRDSLWSQALLPFEAADEMAGDRLSVIRLVRNDKEYFELYTSQFGNGLAALPLNELPAKAGPFTVGEAREDWNALSLDLRRDINRVYSNIGKAIAAFERTLVHQSARFDRYVGAIIDPDSTDSGALLDDREVAGLRLFIDAERTQCLQCHNGPQLSNGEFHNIGTGVFAGEALDFGRSIGLQVVLMDEFNCVGPYSDASPVQCEHLAFLNKDSHLPLRGAFKVPGLRELASTGPYFHDGRFESLREALEYYNEPPSVELVGPHELKPMGLDEQEIAALEAFLLTLSN
jgi:cytochrome c peroxidase